MRAFSLAKCCVILLTIISVSGCGPEKRTVSRQRPAGKLCRITEYRQGIYTIRIDADIAQGTVDVFGPHVSTGQGPRSWGRIQDRLTDSESLRLAALVQQCDLRSFEPQITWFDHCRLLDIGTYIVVSWEDQQRAFAVPPTVIRKRLPTDAAKVYGQMDMIDSCLLRLWWDRRRTTAIVRYPSKDPQVDGFLGELRGIINASVPHARHGW